MDHWNVLHFAVVLMHELPYLGVDHEFQDKGEEAGSAAVAHFRVLILDSLNALAQELALRLQFFHDLFLVDLVVTHQLLKAYEEILNDVSVLSVYRLDLHLAE